MSIDPGDGGDGGVGTFTVPPTEYSRSVGIGLTPAIKTKINNIQTIQLEQLSNTNQKNIAQINDKNIKLLPLESLDQNFLTIITKTTQVQEGGTTIPRYSLAFDLPQAIKDKINNNTRIIQREPTNLLNLIYPIDLTPTDAIILPLKTRANDFMDILYNNLHQKEMVDQSPLT